MEDDTHQEDVSTDVGLSDGQEAYLLDAFFWRNQHLWPTTQGSKIFLAGALHEVGRSLFKEDWTGSEPLVRKMASREPGTPYDRLRRVARWIVRHSDRIATYHGRENGGRLAQAPDSIWNLGLKDPLTTRFFNCRLLDETLIYLDRTGLERALTEVPEPSVSVAAAAGAKNKGGGKPSPHWPAFTAELVQYLLNDHKGGFETGTKGSDTIFNLIADRLAADPGIEIKRETFRPAIVAALKKLADADK